MKDGKKEPEDLMFTVQYACSKHEAKQPWMERELEQRVRELFAQRIVEERVETRYPINNSGMMLKRLQLYVASPEEFWGVVNRRAEEIGRTVWPRLHVYPEPKWRDVDYASEAPRSTLWQDGQPPNCT